MILLAPAVRGVVVIGLYHYVHGVEDGWKDSSEVIVGGNPPPGRDASVCVDSRKITTSSA